MSSSVIPARLEFQCGHAALVSLPRIKGESSVLRNERVTREKAAAQVRACDFCGPNVAIVVQAVAESSEPVVVEPEVVAAVPVVIEAVGETLASVDALETREVAEAVVAEAEAAVAEAEAVVAEAEAVVAEAEAVVAEAEAVVAEAEAVVAEKPAPVGVSAAVRAPRRARSARSAAQDLRRFTVQYRVERVIAASDIGDALRRATALGATDVLAISRE